MYGIEKLSNNELLAIILRTGTKNQKLSALSLAQKILDEFGGLNGLKNTDINQLMEIVGIKKAKAINIIATIELSKRMANIKENDNQKLDTPQKVYNKLCPYLKDENQEHFIVLFLNKNKELIKQKTLFIGTKNVSVIGIYEIIREALLCNSFFIICVHNHPSGDLIPSSYDYEATEEIAEAAKMMQMELFDHIIISKKGFTSLKALGLL